MTRNEGQRDDLSQRASRAHRQLELVFEDLGSSFLHRDELPVLSEAFARLQGALATHFDQEDRLYHPAIVTLRPEHRERLDELRRAHGWFLEQLARMAERLHQEDVDGAADVFREVERAFRLHEAIEETLLASLE
jgi:hypothetical protein